MAIESDVEMVRELVEWAKQCCDDLEHEIEAKYSGTKYTYPSETRKYAADIMPVKELRQSIAKATAWLAEREK